MLFLVAMFYYMLLCVTLCYCMLLCVTVCYCMLRLLLYVSVCYNMLLCFAVFYCMLLYIAACYCMLLYFAVLLCVLYFTVCYYVLLHVAFCCSVLLCFILCYCSLLVLLCYCLLLCFAVCYSVLLCVAVCCCVLLCATERRNEEIKDRCLFGLIENICRTHVLHTYNSPGSVAYLQRYVKADCLFRRGKLTFSFQSLPDSSVSTHCKTIFVAVVLVLYKAVVKLQSYKIFKNYLLIKKNLPCQRYVGSFTLPSVCE